MDNRHLFKCWLWKGLWGFGFISLLFAWVGYNAQAWMWNALVTGVLAISIKLDCKSCKVCNVQQ